jgi:hypothetical protein
MPDLAARLARDLADMRTGHGARRHEMRERLAMVDPELRRLRNLESLRLADLAARLRGGRGDLATLKAAIEASTARLAELDRRIVEAMIASEPRSRPSDRLVPVVDAADPAESAEARSVLRARLMVASATIADLLPESAARQLKEAVAAAIRRLS